MARRPFQDEVEFQYIMWTVWSFSWCFFIVLCMSIRFSLCRIENFRIISNRLKWGFNSLLISDSIIRGENPEILRLDIYNAPMELGYRHRAST